MDAKGLAVRGLGDQEAIIVVLANSHFDEALWQGVHQVNIGRPHGGKIAHIGIIRSLAEVDVVHDLWDEPIQVHIPLAVGMCREIDRDAIHERRKIRAMIQIKAAQQILIGFPAATVLRRYQAGDDLQDFGRAEDGTGFELGLARLAFRGGSGSIRRGASLD